jgi:putative transposase
MPHWQLYYHLIWATKERAPWVTPEVEAFVYEFIRHKVLDLEGTLFSINGMPDHVHVVASIPPKISVAEFVGQIKGVSATRYNKLRRPGAPIYWQEEYGAFSFDKKRLPHLVAYVQGQKQHHADQRLILALEWPTPGENSAVHEPLADYLAPPEDWWAELVAATVE